MKLRSDSARDYTQITESQVLPLLRTQQGFRDQIAFVTPNRSEALGISFWETREAAEAYSLTEYPNALKALANVVVGTPTVENFEF
jgi:hypothetical protein